jgi:hypothetical protein
MTQNLKKSRKGIFVVHFIHRCPLNTIEITKKLLRLRVSSIQAKQEIERKKGINKFLESVCLNVIFLISRLI